jgi:hypothetical protein
MIARPGLKLDGQSRLESEFATNPKPRIRCSGVICYAELAVGVRGKSMARSIFAVEPFAKPA